MKYEHHPEDTQQIFYGLLPCVVCLLHSTLPIITEQVLPSRGRVVIFSESPCPWQTHQRQLGAA